MTETGRTITLIKKEFRQNLIIYLLPFLFMIAIWFLKSYHPQLFSESFSLILAIAVPTALALAYGVQSFDLEESGQTRDFLLVKPLTVRQITWSKYLAGLAPVFFQSLFWKIILAPQIFQWPYLPNLAGFIFLSALCLEILIYSSAFISGLAIKGPLKILGALLCGTIACVWFFTSWYECIKVLTQNTLYQFQLWPYLVLTFYTAIQFLILSEFINSCARFNLKNVTWDTERRAFILNTLFVLLIPLVIFSLSRSFRPAIYQLNPLEMLRQGEKAWFVTIQGVKQPGKSAYAVSDALGRLGLVDDGNLTHNGGQLLNNGGMPRIIFQSQSQFNRPLTQLAWSPEDQNISFCDNGIIRIYSLKEQKIIKTIPGNFAMWSQTSPQILIGKISGRFSFKTARGIIGGDKIQLSLLEVTDWKQIGAFELFMPAMALGWDSQFGKLLVLDQAGTIRLVDLNNGVIREIALPKSTTLTSKILYTKIIPSPQNRHQFLIEVFNSNPAQMIKDQYDINLYLFNTANNSLHHQAILKGIDDLIAVPLNKNILISRVHGVYRHSTLTEEVR